MSMFYFAKNSTKCYAEYKMQKEDLIKRIKIFATIATTAFVFLIVTLLIQFGFIAHYHTQVTELEERNAEMQEEIEAVKKEIEFYKNPNNQI